MPKKSGCSVRRRTIGDARKVCSGAVMLALSGASVSAAPPLPGPIDPPAAAFSQMGAGSQIAPPGTLLIQVQAQDQRAREQAIDFRASNVSGPPGRPIPIRIEVLGNSDKTTGQLFIFSGLPEGVRLSPGGNFGDFWAVNAAVIDELTLTAPPGYSGTFTVWITRSRDQAKTAQSASMTVTIGQPPSLPTAATAAPAPREITAAAPARPRANPPGNEAMLLARAGEAFKKGDVAGARVIYEYLAMQGSATAAMSMGETYDPLVLAKMIVKGLEADPKKAKQWYEKAMELGNRDAGSRLNALAAAR